MPFPLLISCSYKSQSFRTIKYPNIVRSKFQSVCRERKGEMESQMQRPAHQHIEHDDIGLHSGESNQPGEKKSVLKKVKDKAKKVKDTLKKPGQGHGQEHEYRYDENVDEDDDDDDEEIAAPTHDSTVISSKNLPMQLDHNVEKPTDTHGDRIGPMEKGEAKARPNIPTQTEYEQENPYENKHFPSPMKPISVPREDEDAGELDVKLGPSMGLEEDQHSLKFRSGDAPVPPSNYESKVSDPTGEGGNEAGVGQLINRFDHLNVGNAPESDPKSFDSNTTEAMPRDTITGKVSSATSALSDKAISAKNVVASKLGYGGGSGQEGLSPSNKPESAETTPGYTQRITDTLNPVYQKVAGAGTAVMSKFQGGGEAGNQGGGCGQEGMSPSKKPGSESTRGYAQKITETLNPVYEKVAGTGTAVMSKFQGGEDAAATGTDKGVSAKDYWAEKLKPGDEDKALSEAITDALHKKKEGYLQKTGEEKPIGKVTESEDVTGLGTGVEGKREGDDALDARRQSSGPGVVGRVKDAVGSWMGKGSGTQTAQDSINATYVDNAGEQPRLQE